MGLLFLRNSEGAGVIYVKGQEWAGYLLSAVLDMSG